VLDLQTGRPRPNAVVTVPTLGRRTRPDSTGYFRLDSVPPGRYEIVARDLAYRPHHDTLSVSAGGGTIGRVWLNAVTMTLDGCGYVQIARPKPWWKFW
jgi:protocatechuate 3,4-dioxygenase beta subunit